MIDVICLHCPFYEVFDIVIFLCTIFMVGVGMIAPILTSQNIAHDIYKR